MFTSTTADEQVFAVKPMNCPGHVQIFKNESAKLSRLALSRRGIRQGAPLRAVRARCTGSCACAPSRRTTRTSSARKTQITDETGGVCRLLLDIYRDFGFTDVIMKFADRPPKRVGEDAVWDRAEAALTRAMDALGLKYTLNKGEGAFYGPKIEFVLRDAIGRDWQCGTLQVDLNLPARLGATYIGEDGNRHTPVMLHRAIFGSLERFIGILLEHYAGSLPFWLAPQQVVVATITSDADAYAEQVVQQLTAAGLARDARRAQREDQLQGARAQPREGAGDPRGRQARGRRDARSRFAGSASRTKSSPARAAIEQLRAEAGSARRRAKATGANHMRLVSFDT